MLKKVFNYMRYKGMFWFLPDKIFLKMVYKITFNRTLDLKKPKSYNEKLQWIKINDRKDIYTKMVDKYEAKKWAKEIIGDKYIIPTLGVWESFEEIDFDSLPNSFVLKTTHDSGGVYICKDKKTLDLKTAKNKINKSLKRNFYTFGREWPYKNIKPRIIAEKYMEDKKTNDLKDYKFFMFNGKMDSVMVCTGREAGHPDFYFYDENWNRLYYMHEELEKNGINEKPKKYNEMISIAEKLSKGFKHVRVDLYYVNNEIYFGEMTLFDQSGFDTDITYKTDLKWGSKINL